MRGAVEYGFFTFQQLQAHVGCSQISRYAYQVILTGSVTVYGLAFLSLTYTGYADGQSGK